MRTGFKEKFQEKKKYPRLPKMVREEENLNPWGSFITPAFKRIIDARREKEQAEKESSRKSSQQHAEPINKVSEMDRVISEEEI